MLIDCKVMRDDHDSHLPIDMVQVEKKSGQVGDRTCDLLFSNPVTYHLSYRGLVYILYYCGYSGYTCIYCTFNNS